MTEISESEETKEKWRASWAANLKRLLKQSIVKISQSLFFNKLLGKKKLEIDPLQESFARVAGVLQKKLRKNFHLINLRKAYAKELLQRTLKTKHTKLKIILEGFGTRKKEFFFANAK